MTTKTVSMRYMVARKIGEEPEKIIGGDFATITHAMKFSERDASGDYAISYRVLRHDLDGETWIATYHRGKSWIWKQCKRPQDDLDFSR